jgi:hypothetical protein
MLTYAEYMCPHTTTSYIHVGIHRYLDTTFYNLTTVTPHDWRTYEAMRTLAKDKYGISLVETYLPTGSVLSLLALLVQEFKY